MTKKVFDIYKAYMPRLWNVYGRGAVPYKEVPQALIVERERIHEDMEKRYTSYIVKGVLNEVDQMIDYLMELNEKREVKRNSGIDLSGQDC